MEKVLSIDFAQPFQGERWPGTVAQLAFASGAVSRLDAHRRIDEEAAAVFQLRHRPRSITRQQATLHEAAQQAPAYTRLDLGNGVGIDAGGGMEYDITRSGAIEHAVDDHVVKTEVRIERGTEAVDKGHRAERGICSGAGAVRPQTLLHHPQERAQISTLKVGVALQIVAQALRRRQDPLRQRQARDVIREMRRGRHHAPGIARWAYAASLARELDQEIVAALSAAGAGEAVGENDVWR